MAKTSNLFTINIDGSTYGMIINDFHNALKAGFLHYYTRNANISFRFVTGTARADAYVRTKELYLGNGRHARGWYQPGSSTVYLHNGWIAKGHSTSQTNKEGFWFQAIASQAAAANIVAHEFWHFLFNTNSHSNNINCLMNQNATAVDLCEVEKLKLQAKFGKPIAYKAEDVNRDGFVTSQDVLLVINSLNAKGPHQVTVEDENLDVNKDGYVSSADALQIINCINNIKITQ